ncbi:hypothetical protein COB21_04230 [Candidatus Aerophobetes bacterium]|uniref:Uncharacterized protein n=1 Tax=Aerophobetes bacterium TaxID=2030807 RepID=A0A2A4X1Z8_UNCAE|nr:MAG: hypothetical protein COB21_04230 [Candidatus Aerophobetes bacterium]
MSVKSFPENKQPLILRFHRLMDAFAKSDDEKDFYLDKVEGFLVFADLNKDFEEYTGLQQELKENNDRYAIIPKMTFYETKKFMEGFVNEKVYDIDTKEKLLDIISDKEARQNFLEFIYDHLSELEKWKLYYQERSRVRIIEWLRKEDVYFVFEEDLDVVKNLLQKVKQFAFSSGKVPKEVQAVRQSIYTKAKTYYSNEALNPRPKRGRPPKQAVKVEVEPTYTLDAYKMVPPMVRQFLFVPDYTEGGHMTFSNTFEEDERLRDRLKGTGEKHTELKALSEKLKALTSLSDRLKKTDGLDLSSDSMKTHVIIEDKKESKITGLAKGVLPQAFMGAAAVSKKKVKAKQVTKIESSKKGEDDDAN